MSDDLRVFAAVQQPQLMRAWLNAQRDMAVKGLLAGRDLVVIHQAQGRVQILDKMLELLDKAQAR